jgi:hypothetical protein
MGALATRSMIAAIVIGQSCGTSPARAPLSPGHLGAIRAESLVLVTRIVDLPPMVRVALQRAFEATAPAFLDPEDSVSALRLLWGTSRRLVIGACGPDHCVVQYEHAGAGRTLYLLVLGLNPDNAQVEWSGVTRQRARTAAELKSVVLRVAAGP